MTTLTASPDRFTSYAIAESFAGRCAKATMILLGDDGRFWVVGLAAGERLVRAGYEVAR